MEGNEKIKKQQKIMWVGVIDADEECLLLRKVKCARDGLKSVFFCETSRTQRCGYNNTVVKSENFIEVSLEHHEKLLIKSLRKLKQTK